MNQLLLFLLFNLLVVNIFTLRIVGKNDPTENKRFQSPACHLKPIVAEIPVCFNDNKTCESDIFSRIVSIGDIHGSYSELMQDLYLANITISESLCEWQNQTINGNSSTTLLVQMGDIVDRGDSSLQALLCLRHLQSTASTYHSKVIRLIGNHDIWWLEGNFRMANAADSKEIKTQIIRYTLDDITSGLLVGAYHIRVNGCSILFTHGGINRQFFTYITQQATRIADENDAEMIERYVNGLLYQTISNCPSFPCRFKHPLFDAGPDSGGRGIGGPFWSRYQTLERDSFYGFPLNFIQVVGHTAAHGDESDPEPLIQHTRDLRAICVDAAMYAGNRAFLEINTMNGEIQANEMRPKGLMTRDLSIETGYC